MELCQLGRKYFEVYRLRKKKKENVIVPEFGRRQENVRVQFILLKRAQQIQTKLKWNPVPELKFEDPTCDTYPLSLVSILSF